MSRDKRRNARGTSKNYEKIQYLERYHEVIMLEKRISDSIDTLHETSMQAKSPKYDGMPHSHDTERDLSDLMVKLDKEFARLFKMQRKAIAVRKEIESSINSLEKEKERMVLWLRYIKFYSWERVAVEMNYNYDHVIRIHGCALEHLNIKL